MKKYIYYALLLSLFAARANAQGSPQPLSRGGSYTILNKSTGDRIKIADVVTFDVVQKTDKDSLLGSSYAAGRPAKLQVKRPEEVTEDPVLPYVMEALPFAALHDSLLVRIPTDTLIKGHEEQRPPFFPKGSYLNLYIKIENIQTLNDAKAELMAEIAKAKAAETAEANKYIADNKLILKTTASGLKYKVTKVGLKPKPLSGDTVLVNYAGRLLNGKVFDTSIASIAKASGLDQPGRPYEPIKFVVGQSKVIPGWDEGLLLMNEGSKAFFVVPSALAYGDQGTPDGNIPPFSTLAFDVELVKVIRIKHAAPVTTTAKKHTVTHHTTVKKTN